MNQQHVPRDPIKPPLYCLQPGYDIPRLPEIDPKQAVVILTNENASARAVARGHIKCLREIIASLLATDGLPDDLDQVLFENVVIERADLSELAIPFALYFQRSFFLDGLNLNSSQFQRLDISGYVGYGLSLVETRGQPKVNLGNIEADQVHIYGGEGLGHFEVSFATIGTITIASTMVSHEICMHDSVAIPGGLWLENLSVGQGLCLVRCSISRHSRIHDVRCTGDIDLQVCSLDAPLSTRSSSCAKLSLSESKCSGRLDFRGLSFQEIDLSNTTISGQLLLNLNQLQRREDTVGSARRRQKWDAVPCLLPQRSSTLQESVTVAEQLIVLRENFQRIPTADDQERYCAYQLADSTWAISRWAPLNEFGRWVAKHGFGYLLFPWRIARAMVSLVLFFTCIYLLVAVFGFGDLLSSGGTSVLRHGILLDVSRCLYFSTVTFATASYGDIYPVGAARIVSVVEAFAGLIVNALFAVSVARRLFRW